MKKLIVACGIAWLAAPAVQAQGFLPPPITNPFDRPPGAFFWGPSPYYQPGTVYGGGRGRITDAMILQQLQQIQAQQTLLAGQFGPASPYAPTGHPTRFGSYNQYFMNYGGTGRLIGTAPGVLPPLATQPGC